MLSAILNAIRRLWSRPRPRFEMDARRERTCDPASFLALIAAERPDRLTIDEIKTDKGGIRWRFHFETRERTPDGDDPHACLVFTKPFIPLHFRALAEKATWADAAADGPDPSLVRQGHVEKPADLVLRQTAH